MKRVPPRFDDEDDANRAVDKARTGGWRTVISANEAMTVIVPPMETGLKVKAGASRGGKEGGKQRRDERAENYKKWQAIADIIWFTNPKLSKVAVARIIFRRLNESDRFNTCVRTIREHIERPDATL